MTQADKLALVTGGAEGIGAAICRKLATDGHTVLIWDRQIEPATKVAEGICANGGQAAAFNIDLGQRAEVLAGVKRMREEFGPISVLVNNAGVSPEQNFEDISEEDFDRVININLKGLFFCTQAVVPDMKQANWGRVINISSSSAQSGATRMAHYAASKGAVIGFSKALAQELGQFGITVNNVPPSFIHTKGLEAVAERLPGGIEGFAKHANPMHKVGQPEDIAAAVAFLASDAAGYITGHTLSVNGGRYMS